MLVTCIDFEHHWDVTLRSYSSNPNHYYYGWHLSISSCQPVNQNTAFCLMNSRFIGQCCRNYPHLLRLQSTLLPRRNHSHPRHLLRHQLPDRLEYQADSVQTWSEC